MKQGRYYSSLEENGLYGSSLTENDDTSEQDQLFYLENSGKDLPPLTREVLALLTSCYIDDKPIPKSTIESLFLAIDKEYNISPVPFEILSGNEEGNKILFDKLGKEDLGAINVFSFSALNSLPFEITTFLCNNIVQQQDLKNGKMNEIFAKFRTHPQKWKSIHFPLGLSLRYKRKFLPRRGSNSFMIPRRMRSTRWSVNQAEQCIRKANKTKPPNKRTTLVVLDSMDSKLQPLIRLRSTISQRWQKITKDDVPFFPRKKGIVKFWKTQSQKLKSAGRAGILSYGVLNFAWYTIALLFSWKRLSNVTHISSDGITTVATMIPAHNKEAILLSFQKFFKVLGYVYAGSQVTKILRLSLAVACAPLGDKMLKYVQRKWGMGEAQSFWILTASMIGLCLGFWALVIFWSAIGARCGTFHM